MVHSLSCVQFFVKSWTAALQASLSFTISWCLLRLMSIELVMPSKHLILCHTLLFLPSIFPSIRESLRISELVTSGGQSIGNLALASVLPMNIQNWFPLRLTSQISLQFKWFSSHLQHHSSKVSIFQHSAIFLVQLSHPYDYWKNYSFDYVDLCWQINISPF